MIAEKAKWLSVLTREQRMVFFHELNHCMTVSMRSICRSDLTNSLERAYELNEAHHAVSGYLLRIDTNSESDRWLAVLIKSLLRPDDQVLRQQIDQCWLAAESKVLDQMK